MNKVYQEFVVITNTINSAKNCNYYSGILNLNDIRDIITNEEFDTPVINILEYSDVHVLSFNSAIITFFKFPI